jgi:hypothetical protein
MTGRELIAWITENHADDMEILFLQDDGIVTRINPEIQSCDEAKEWYWEASFLPDEGSVVIL